MDDCGYHGFDDADEMAERYCMRCKNQTIEINNNGVLWKMDCNKDCSLAYPKYFEEEEQEDE